MPLSPSKAISSSQALAAAAAAAAAALPQEPTPNTHTTHTFQSTSSTYNSVEYLLYLPSSWTPNPDKPLPIILFLHGAGEINKGKCLCKDRATGRKSLVNDGAWRLRTVPGMLPALVDQLVKQQEDVGDEVTEDISFPFILISPQCPKPVRFGSSQELMNDLVHIIHHDVCQQYNGDASNVFVTGLSMGGCGTWSIATQHSNVFKAAAPICGGFSGFQESLLRLRGIWCFHGANDSVIPVNQSDVAVRKLKKGIEMQKMFGLSFASKKTDSLEVEGKEEGEEIRKEIEVKYTRYETSPTPIGAPNMKGHGSWIQAYFESELLVWFEGMVD